ncbi:MAG: hypothetical protein QNJ97_20975 [Myxococcota bacterium]|nr:hypothetical protein [Myxococcota bacterium]
MNAKKNIFILMISLLLTVLPSAGAAFDVTGGHTWYNRTGPGLSFSLGINGCAREYCDDVWDTGASIGATLGFFYRVIPNLVIFADIHTGHIPVDYDSGLPFGVGDLDDDNAFVFQATAGAEFHLPITGWLAPYAGFGMGFAYMGVWGDIEGGGDLHGSLRGVDFQLRFGADFFPFSRIDNLSFGPALYFGLPYWSKMCYEVESDLVNNDDCDDPDDMVGDDYDDELPFIVYFGIMGKYHF